MDEYTDKYITNLDNLEKTLEEYGVAVIPSVLSKDECKKIVEGFWDYFEHISQKWPTPISREDSRTWRGIYRLYPLHSMLIQFFNIGQAQFCWDVRQNPAVADIYSRIYNCPAEKLLVSFDGVSFAAPPEETGRGWWKNTWYHCDQSFARNERECIQGWVNAYPTRVGDATLAIMEGSHKYHAEFREKFHTSSGEWKKLTPEEQQFYVDKGCSYRRIMCPRGSLVLWDSRTIHCGTEAIKGREKPNFRAVVYVCYGPRELATEKNIKKKQQAFQEMRLTTHHPYRVRLFAKYPRTYGGEVPEITQINPPILTDLGKKLAGLNS
jgi:ectoine hydroxylase-related dioxygenase (phytanoyl-CoA dioxygenase family)